MRLIFIIIILSSINLIAGNGLSFKIDIESSGIPYMPIKAVLEVRNDTGMDIKIPDTKGNLYELIDNKYTKERIKFFKFEVNGKIDSSCFSNEKGKYILKEQKYKTLKAGEKEIYKCSNIEGFLGIIDEGIYYLRGIWDSSEGKGYKCRWESEWIKIELRAEGEDRTLIEELKKNYPNGYKCMLIDLAYNKNLGEYVLEKYPTSTYAGWVLLHLQNIGGVIPIREKELIKKKANIIASGLDRKILNPDWDTYKIVEGKKVHTRDLYEKNAFYQEKFISANPDFIFSSNISTSLADGYLYYLGETKKGCYYLELALKLDKWWGYNEREAESMKEGAKFYLEELKRLGVCK